MTRGRVAGATAVLLLAEAVGVALLNWFLGLVVNEQRMSLAGIAPRAMTTSAWVAGLLFGGYLLLCGLFLLRTALRGPAPGGFVHILLVSCAVVHGLLAALSVGLAGWPAFLFLMTVCALLVWTVIAYGDDRPRRRPGIT